MAQAGFDDRLGSMTGCSLRMTLLLARAFHAAAQKSVQSGHPLCPIRERKMLTGIKARAERAAALGRAAGQPGADRISTRRC